MRAPETSHGKWKRKTPWKVHSSDWGGSIYHGDTLANEIGSFVWGEDAALATHCVNTMPDVVEALGALIPMVSRDREGFVSAATLDGAYGTASPQDLREINKYDDALAIARTALALAKGSGE